MEQRPRGSDFRRSAVALIARAVSLALLTSVEDAHAFTVAITPAAPKTIFLQIGVGSFTGFYDAGGTPQNNATINKETVAVAAAAVGNGTAQAMTTDSTQTHSFYDNFVFCSVPAQLYIGGFYRTTGAGTGTANVTATVPVSLSDGAGDTIAFSQISWTSAGNGDTGAQPFPAGSFTGTTVTVGSIAQNQWAESCWTFSYKNTVLPPAGTYTGRVLYTLTVP
ncbi:MAG TPA: hypothetical protein VL220_07060 [Steroidobacteraceae bacterium]|jgi:hypothetical protein|nr:hypothetical protein [Steroidobacteraceae bacterium]